MLTSHELGVPNSPPMVHSSYSSYQNFWRADVRRCTKFWYRIRYMKCRENGVFNIFSAFAKLRLATAEINYNCIDAIRSMFFNNGLHDSCYQTRPGTWVVNRLGLRISEEWQVLHQDPLDPPSRLARSAQSDLEEQTLWYCPYVDLGNWRLLKNHQGKGRKETYRHGLFRTVLSRLGRV